MSLAPELNKEIRQAWHRFVYRTADVRGDLHRYCRSLTGSAWDAEDLVQDTLLRAFAKLGEVHYQIANTKAYLFRIASNLWIDRVRRSEPMPPQEPASIDNTGRGAEVRDAARELLERLPPQERAAVVLKDVFDFSLEEIADTLDTTVGSIKSALHRGRTKLDPGQPSRPARPAGEHLLDAFVDAFNARDIDRLTSLLRSNATAEVVGMVEEHGPEAIRRGSMHHTMFDEEGEPRAERREYNGEPVVVLWYTIAEQGSTRAVRDVLRFEEQEEMISRLRYYYFCPETLHEIVGAFGLPLVDNGYCYRPNDE